MTLTPSITNILLVDANIAKCGWAVYDALTQQVTAAGTIKTVPCAKKRQIRKTDDKFDRFRTVFTELAMLVEQHNIQGLIFELPTCGSKSSTASGLMHAGIAVCACLSEMTQLPFECYTPMENKKGSTGKNNGSKEEIQAVVTDRWPGVDWPKTALIEDAADAASLAFIAEQKGTLCKQLRNFGNRLAENTSIAC